MRYFFVLGRVGDFRRGRGGFQEAAAPAVDLVNDRFDDTAFLVADSRGAVCVAVFLNEFAKELVAWVGIRVFAAQDIVGTARGSSVRVGGTSWLLLGLLSLRL